MKNIKINLTLQLEYHIYPSDMNIPKITHTEEEVEKIVAGIKSIEDKNVRAVVFSKVWWEHFGYYEKAPDSIKKLKLEVGYPSVIVSARQADKAQANIPKKFRLKFEDFEGSPERLSEDRNDEKYMSMEYNVTEDVFM